MDAHLKHPANICVALPECDSKVVEELIRSIEERRANGRFVENTRNGPKSKGQVNCVPL